MNKIIIEQELLFSLYYGSNYSTRDIAKMFDCGQTTVRRKLKKYNILAKTYDNKEWREYISQKISINESKYEIEPEMIIIHKI